MNEHDRALASAVMRTAQQHYGFTARSWQVMHGEIDVNYRLINSAGTSVLAKVSPPGSVDPVALAWQHALLRRVNDASLNLSVPAPIHTLAGQQHVQLKHDGARHTVRLQTWVDGSMLSSCPAPSKALLRDIGRTSALLTEALDGLRSPAGLEQHDWLVGRARSVVEHNLRLIGLVKERREITAILEFFDERSPNLEELPHSTVHQDLNDHNILVDIDAPNRVTGVIDFNDAYWSPRVADVAIAGTYVMLRQPDPIDRFTAVLAGYCEITDLSRDELAAYFPIAALRLCVNWTVWRVRQQSAATEYGATRSAATWPLISTLVSMGLDNVQHQIVTSIAKR